VRYWVGFDVGKAFHWVCVLNEEGEVVLSRKVEATERGLEACREELAAFGDPSERRIGVDLVGGPATLLQAVLLGGGERLFRISGMALITFGEEEGFGVNAGALFLLLAAVSASIYFTFQKPYLEKHGSLLFTAYVIWAGARELPRIDALKLFEKASEVGR
jgi:hypothetical protein